MSLGKHPSSAKVSEFRNKKVIPQTFEEAIVSGDVPVSKSVNKQCPESISPAVCEEEESLSEYIPLNFHVIIQ